MEGCQRTMIGDDKVTFLFKNLTSDCRPRDIVVHTENPMLKEYLLWSVKNAVFVFVSIVYCDHVASRCSDEGFCVPYAHIWHFRKSVPLVGRSSAYLSKRQLIFCTKMNEFDQVAEE